MKHSISNGQKNKAGSFGIGKTLLIGAFWIMIWQLSYFAVGKDLILPSPYDTFRVLVSMIFTREFYENTGATMYRVIAGIILSFFAGTITALLSYVVSPIRDLLGFVIVFLKSTPVMAVILFAILWLTSANVPIFACFLMCYPVVYTNVLSGLDSMKSEFLEMGRVFRLTPVTTVRYLYYPSVLPHLNSALSLVAGLSWKTVVAAEVLSSPGFSMGYHLLNAKIYLETDQLFAWILAIVGFSILFETAIKGLIGIRRKKRGLDGKEGSSFNRKKEVEDDSN